MTEHGSRHQTETQDENRLGKLLFPPRRVPSFAEVVGADAAAEYRRNREDLNAQELANRRRSRTTRGLGRKGLG